jgi:hypothetical protein
MGRLGDRADHILGDLEAHSVVRDVERPRLSSRRFADADHGRGFDRAVDVLAGDAPASPGAVDSARVDPMLLKRPPDGGRKARFPVSVWPDANRGAFGSWTYADFARHQRLGLSRIRADPPKQRSRHRLGVGVEHDLGEHTRSWSGHFLGDLVGLKLHQGIVLGDRVAELLEPGADDCLGALLLVGDSDLDQRLEPNQPVDLGADPLDRRHRVFEQAWMMRARDVGHGHARHRCIEVEESFVGDDRRRFPRRSRRYANPRGRSGNAVFAGHCRAPSRGPTASACAGRSRRR